jgi:hypothetical protein
MPTSAWARVKQGKIELLDPVDLPEGARVLVTIFPASEPPPVSEKNLEREQPLPDVWLDQKPTDGIWDTIQESSEPFLPLPSSQSSSLSR